MSLLERLAEQIIEANHCSFSESVVKWSEIRKILEEYHLEHLQLNEKEISDNLKPTS